MEENYLGRPSWVEVDLDAITNNVNIIKKIVGDKVSIIGTLKGQGYGHGLIPVAKHLVRLGIPILAVGNILEGIRLRKNGVSVPIQVFGNTLPESAQEYYDYDLMPSFINFSDPEKYLEVLGPNKILKVWIKVETGLGRLGVPINKVIDLITYIRGNTPYIIDGLYTHSGAYGMNSKSYYEWQWKQFNDLLKKIENMGIEIPYKQFASSGPTLSMPHTRLNCVALGQILYTKPEIENPEDYGEFLSAYKSIKSKLISIKRFKSGTKLGDFEFKRDTLIGIAPIGTADGLSSKIKDKSVLINGERAFIRGHISLEYIKIDVTDIPNVSIGNEVLIIGTQGNKSITVEDMCDRLGISKVEFWNLINHMLIPHIYIKNNKVIENQL